MGEAFHFAPSLRKALPTARESSPWAPAGSARVWEPGALTVVPPARCEGTLLSVKFLGVMKWFLRNSRFKRCLNDFIKAAEENAQAMRNCSSDEEVFAVLVLLCRGYGMEGPREKSAKCSWLYSVWTGKTDRCSLCVVDSYCRSWAAFCGVMGIFLNQAAYGLRL